MTLNQNSNSIPLSFPLLLKKLKHIFLYNLLLSVYLPPAATDSQESRLFLHFDRLLCQIIGGFLVVLALPVISANEKMSSATQICTRAAKEIKCAVCK